MSATNWNLRLTDETHHTLTLEISEGEKLLGHTELSTVGVEKLIHILAALRSKMSPEVDKSIPAGAPPSGPANPVYAVLDVPVVPGKMLMLRHEGLGWQSFLLPQHEADRMAHGLLEQPKPQTAPSSNLRQ